MDHDRINRANEHPQCTLKMQPPPYFWYHVTNDRCVCVDSLLVKALIQRRNVSKIKDKRGELDVPTTRVADMEVTPTISILIAVQLSVWIGLFT